MDQLAKQIADASGGKITASFDATNQRFFFSSSATGAENDFKFEASASDPNSEAALKKLGLMDDGQRGDESTEDYEKRRMSKQDATDAQIELNGAFLTSKNNNIVVDALGITIDVTNGKSGDEMTIGVSRDTDAAYNVIKDFVKEYNNLITEMNEKYEPLTEDEEAQLTETQLKQWEEKAKADLLSRDDRLNSIITNMRSILASSVSITKDDGSVGKFSLSSFGIVTGNYTEYGLLHIQGDEDDPDYADKTNKLKEALEKDPDRVMNTFAEIGTKLYDKITKMTDASNRTVRSYGNIYDDKTYTNKIDDYEDEIEKLQKRLEEIQDKYYKQFSAMEVAMSKVNATASQLGFTPLTGGGQ